MLTLFIIATSADRQAAKDFLNQHGEVVSFGWGSPLGPALYSGATHYYSNGLFKEARNAEGFNELFQVFEYDPEIVLDVLEAVKGKFKLVPTEWNASE